MAACWVVIYHVAYSAKAGTPTRVLINHGYLAVDLFFLLSGFVLALNYGHAFSDRWILRTYIGFLQKRIARIYPLFVISVVGFVVLARSGYLYNLHAFYEDLPLNLALMASWHTNASTFDGPAWSISCEWLAYLMFPVLCRLTLGGSRLVAIASIAGSLAILVALVSLPAWRLHESGFRSGPLDIWVNSTFGPVARCVAEFNIGVGLFRIGLAPFWRRVTSGRAYVPAVTAVMLLLLSFPGTDLAIVGLFALLILGLSTSDGAIATGLGSAPIHFLGVISYSVYLLHAPILAGFREIWVHRGIEPTQLLSAAILLAATLPAATASYFIIERPGRNFIARLPISPAFPRAPAPAPGEPR